MLVQGTGNTQEYINSTKNKKEENSSVKFDISKPFDEDNFSFEDYKSIDGKVFGDWLKKSNLSNAEQSRVSNLWMMAHHTDDDILNQVLFDKLNSSNEDDFSSFTFRVLIPLMEMENIIDFEALSAIEEQMEKYEKSDYPGINETFTVTNNSIKMDKYMVDGELKFRGSDIISNMKYFSVYYDNLSKDDKSLFTNPSDTAQIYAEIVVEYTKQYLIEK